MIDRIKSWFKDLADKWSGIKKEYSDNYQIRKITLVDGTNKYYPEYKGSSLDNWSQLRKLEGGIIDTVQLQNNDLVTSNNYHTDTQEEALAVITEYKAQLLIERAKDFKLEEIIKVD